VALKAYRGFAEKEMKMARWKLTDGHYLNVPGIEWEYKESDRETGRSARKVYNVPLYLNPKNREDWNYPQDEAIIVTDKEDRAHPRDILFVGPPTPDMEALDDEAQAISQKYIDSGAWKHPIEALNMTYSQSILSEFEMQIAQHLAGVAKQQPLPPNVSVKGVDPADFAKMQEQVAALMEENMRLKSQPVRRRL
jgi:hypothetical protein